VMGFVCNKEISSSKETRPPTMKENCYDNEGGKVEVLYQQNKRL